MENIEPILEELKAIRSSLERSEKQAEEMMARSEKQVEEARKASSKHLIVVAIVVLCVYALVFVPFALDLW